MQHTATGPARLGDFHGYIVILPTGQAGPQTFDLQRQVERQQQAGIEAVQIVAVTGQHRVHDIEPYLRFRMGIERPHDARHIDALAPCLQRHRAGDRDLRQMWAVASRDLHRQAEVRDADMLYAAIRTPDQRGGTILQIRQGRAIGVIRYNLRIAGRETGMIVDIGLLPACSVSFQQGHCGLGFSFGRLAFNIRCVDSHMPLPSVRAQTAMWVFYAG